MALSPKNMVDGRQKKPESVVGYHLSETPAYILQRSRERTTGLPKSNGSYHSTCLFFIFLLLFRMGWLLVGKLTIGMP